ncbi:FAD-dependent oxidoreductase [Sphingomonas sp. MMS24-J13]|uniref:FAD-dependent oxidoreductase n=1 Tax=Sphingomonas sp. MMS24-J13 TaxID=3238686 RepID=UPI00384C2E6F
MIANALIVGGGVGGMTAAIALRRAGVDVTLIDADPDWRVYGAGISVTGISLRAFDDLGILDRIRARGHVGAGMRGKTVAGQTVFEPPVPENPRPVEQSGGIMRPVLHDILSSIVRAEGVTVRLGVKVQALVQDDDGVDVGFTDGSEGRYDLVVGADGIFSQIRGMIFPDVPRPKFTGQGCWRVVAKRPPEVDRTEMYFGGPVKLGINPVSADEMYMFILEHVPDNPFFAEAEMVSHVRALLEPFGGAVPAVRESLTDAAQINYRPLEWLLLPKPWHQGRVVLIGDAAHATTPHMASGAGIAAEDGLVLADELKRHDAVADALDAFVERRFERARLVVENSVMIGDMEMAGDMSNKGPTMLGATMHQLQQPY